MIDAEADRLEKELLPEILSDGEIAIMSSEHIEALVDDIRLILARLTTEVASLEQDEQTFRRAGFLGDRKAKLQKERVRRDLQTYQAYYHKLRCRWRQLAGYEP